MNYLMLFFGIGLAILAVVLLLIDRKKANCDIKDLERANAQTEYLIEELNELSSILVDEMEKKYIKMLDIYEQLLAVPVDEQQKDKPKQDKSLRDGTISHNKHDDILQLFNSGNSPADIASKMGMGTGEVELIIKFANREFG